MEINPKGNSSWIGHIHPEAIETLRVLGYTEQEARFLYLVVTFSGFFTRQQFLRLTGKTKGWAVHRFTEKLLARGHASFIKLGGGVYLFQLHCREMYDALDKPNLRVRSACSEDFIRARLFTLDFVLSHPGVNYLESSVEKMAFFAEKMGLPTKILPGKTYAGIHFRGHHTLYFTDRQPIFLEPVSLSDTNAVRPVFVYCDPYPKTLDAFKTHLRHYQNLLYRLPGFRFVHASPHSQKFARARRAFDSFMRTQDRVDVEFLIRYFRVRWLWEAENPCEMTREDRDLIRAGDKRFCGEPFVSIYQKWCQESVGKDEIKTLLGPCGLTQNFFFETYSLPDSYDIFRREWCAPERTIP